MIETTASKIAVVTGTRAEFGLLEGTIDRLENQPGSEVELVVAGMHLIDEFGGTVDEIEDRFPIAAKVPMHPPQDTRRGMGEAVADGLNSFIEVLSRLAPDLLLVLGDRTEAFAAALAAAYLDIPIAHVHGGDVTGNPIDDFQRDAISRVARLHLAATEVSAKRLESMAIPGELVVVGAPGLDAILAENSPSRDMLREALGLDWERWVLVLHHPMPMGPHRAAEETRSVLDAAAAVAGKLQNAGVVVIYPNNDAGYCGIVDEIHRREVVGLVKVFRSLPRKSYLGLLHHSSLLIGNSSSGVIESVSLGVPVINVGERQRGRERNGNVVDAPPLATAIVEAANKAFSDPGIKEALRTRHNIYGDGKASERIVTAIERFLATRKSAGACECEVVPI